MLGPARTAETTLRSFDRDRVDAEHHAAELRPDEGLTSTRWLVGGGVRGNGTVPTAATNASKPLIPTIDSECSGHRRRRRVLDDRGAAGDGARGLPGAVERLSHGRVLCNLGARRRRRHRTP
jgi:hypothetical protein